MKIRIRFKGIKPLIMNRHIEMPRYYRRKQKKTIEQRVEEKVFRDSEGRPGIPRKRLMYSIELARRFLGMARKTAHFTVIEEPFMPFEDDARMGTFIHKLHHVPRRNPFFDAFPKFDEWAFSSTLIVADSEMKEETARKLFDTAGQKIGMGFLANRKGYFGRFEVTMWCCEPWNRLLQYWPHN